MQYPGIALSGDYLERETERQQRLQQEARKAFEQKRAQLRGEPLKPEVQSAPFPAQHAPLLQPSVAAQVSANESIARLCSIPEIRSALIPLDEALEGKQWSKPFSLVKAEMEPWAAYLQGYYGSRLFPLATDSPGSQLTIDVAVQALLELKRIDPHFILEPVVQIDQPAEFLDLSAELQDCRDPVQARRLIAIANDVHEAQLVKAIEKGRELGDHLYQALLGEGFVNLIHAWGRVYKRKPSVNELHHMLTNGSVRVMPDAPSVAIREHPLPERTTVIRRPPPEVSSPQPVMRDEKPQTASYAPLATSAAQASTPLAVEPDDTHTITFFGTQFRLTRWQKILLQVFNLALCSAAVAAYFFIV